MIIDIRTELVSDLLFIIEYLTGLGINLYITNISLFNKLKDKYDNLYFCFEDSNNSIVTSNREVTPTSIIVDKYQEKYIGKYIQHTIPEFMIIITEYLEEEV